MLDDELPAVSIARLVLTLTPRGPAAAAIEQALMSAEQLAAALQLLGEAPVAWGLQEARRSLGVVEQSFAGVPDLPRRQIGLSLEAPVLDWLTALIDRAARGASVQFIPPMAREAARLEVPFGDVIESMRATQGRCIAAIFAAHTTASRASSPHVAQELVSTTAEVFDTEIGRFLGVYMGEREAVVESQLARRRDVVAELLSDTSCEDSPGLRLDLGIDLHRFQVGIVVMRESGAPGLDSRPLKRAICAALDDAQVLIIPAGHNRLWAWVGTVMEPDHVCHDGLRKALAAQTGIRAAVGAPAPGVVGFRETHRQALDAAALQGYDSPGEPVTSGANMRCSPFWVSTSSARERSPTGFWVRSRRAVRPRVSSA